MIETWVDIKGLEGKYQVSNLGRVKSLARTGIRKDGKKYKVSEKIKKQSIFNNGYYGFGTDRENGTFLIHRVLAETFIPNPKNKKAVNHKNGIKTDNRLDNLEWATYGENNQHAYNTGLKKVTKKMRNNARSLILVNGKNHSKLVINMSTGIFYNSIKEAAESVGMVPNTLQGKLLGRIKNKTPFRYV